jgi:hypothetical protein
MDAVRSMIVQLIDDGHTAGVPVGICGKAPSNYPEFAQFLVAAGNDSMSLSPDSVIDTLRMVAEIEQQQKAEELQFVSGRGLDPVNEASAQRRWSLSPLTYGRVSSTGRRQAPPLRICRLARSCDPACRIS